MCVSGLHILGAVLFRSGLDLRVSHRFGTLSFTANLMPLITTRFLSTIAVLAVLCISAAQLKHKELHTKKVGMNSCIYIS